MTSSAVHLLVRRTAATRRADPLVVALLVAAVSGLAVVWALTAPGPRPALAARAAVVVDAAGHPHAALSRARSVARPGDAVRVPRTAAEAVVDLRYLAAAGYARVVAVGPVARTAADAVAAEYPRTRFVVR